jgi:hypothetical protein
VPNYPITINGVQCYIAHRDDRPGIVRRFTEYGPEITVFYKCAWGDLQNLAAGLLGYITVDSGGNVTRIPPYNLPFQQQLYCTSIGEEEPFTPNLDESGYMYYSQSIISATFSALTWQVSSDDPSGRFDPSGLPYTTTKFRVSGETYQPAVGTYYYGPFTGSTGKLLGQGGQVGFIRANVEIAMSRHWIPDIPLADAMSLYGCVNEDAITLANFTFPSGYLLFTGFNSEPRNDPNGYPVQDLEYTFMGRSENEWNEVLTTDGTYQYMNTEKDGSGDPPFEYVDFSDLFD